jgi:hypothetical protein
LLRIRLSWFLCVRSRQALVVVELLLLLLLEAVPMKSPPLEPLSTKGTRAWQRCTRSARSIQTWNLEAQKYLTSSMAIPIIEDLCESLRSTRMYYTTIDAPRGVKILEDIIEGFNKRFGEGTHITELREGHGRQPCGYTQVRCVCFVLGALVRNF